jgi:phage gpG-like protein
MLDLAFELEGVREVRSGLQELAVSLSAGSKKRVMAAARVISRQIKADFERGGPEGDPWDDIQPQTRQRRVKSKDGPPLTDTGAMKKAATALRPGVPGSAFSFTGRQIVMGVDDPRMAVHQEGNDHIPARPFINVEDRSIVEIERAVGRDIEHTLRGLGGRYKWHS